MKTRALETRMEPLGKPYLFDGFPYPRLRKVGVLTHQD